MSDIDPEEVRRALNTQGALAMIAEARRQLSNAERDLVRAVYRQERS